MRSVDTNILARYVIGDDPAQADLAAGVLEGPCFVADTVLLETAWLLSSRYRMARKDIASTLADLISLPQLTVSNAEAIAWAIRRFAEGADFADMMHVMASRDVDSFISFERKLAKLAGADTPVPIEILA